MILDRRAAARDRVVEVARGEHVLAGQYVAAVQAPGLAHADPHRRPEQVGVLIAGDLLDEEAHVLLDLAAALPLGVR